jgi:hypothetical protein
MMMLRILKIAMVMAVAQFVAGHSDAHPVKAGALKPLNDAQLDKIAAGAYATAKGDGSATGQLSSTEVSVSSTARSGTLSDGFVTGQVTSIGVSAGNSQSSASSSLSLTFSYP